MSLDPIDLILIDAIQQNASRRLEDLGRMVNLAPSSVHERLRKLERDGVIRRWTVDLDAQAVGLDVCAFVGIRGGKTKVSVEDIAKIPEVEEIHSVAGDLCFLLKVRVPDTTALLALIGQLREIPGIEATHSTIVLKTQLDRPFALPHVPAPKPNGNGHLAKSGRR